MELSGNCILHSRFRGVSLVIKLWRHLIWSKKTTSLPARRTEGILRGNTLGFWASIRTEWQRIMSSFPSQRRGTLTRRGELKWLTMQMLRVHLHRQSAETIYFSLWWHCQIVSLIFGDATNPLTDSPKLYLAVIVVVTLPNSSDVLFDNATTYHHRTSRPTQFLYTDDENRNAGRSNMSNNAPTPGKGDDLCEYDYLKDCSINQL